MSSLRDILTTTMEGNIQPSFIPKKPLMARPLPPVQQKPARTINFFTLIIMVIFLTTLIITGVVYAYKYYLNKHKEDLKTELTEKLDTINKAEVSELTRVSTRLSSTKTLINNHLALSEFFNFLSKTTLQNIQFLSFRYVINGPSIDISMKGQAKNFTSVALQSMEFLKEENRKAIDNPQFSNLNLDEAGNVSFSFTGRVKPDQFLYRNVLKESNSSESPAVDTHATSTSH